MIIKGGSRAAPKQLGRHLLRTDTNERVQILELQSPIGDLTEALRDWQFLAGGTRGEKGLYHANIDPDARYTMTPDQWRRAVEVLEEKLGFQGQPRAVVLHEKHGRQHIHVVWQRTDIEAMKLRPDSHNYRKHEEASLALEMEFGHEHVPGKHAKRDREKQPEIPKAAFNQAEWQQAERAAIDPRERKEAITKLYEQSDSGLALKAALEEHGYILAQGDRRDFVIVDQDGQIHSLGRQIGIKAKDLREFMGDVDRESLPSAEHAKTSQRTPSGGDQVEAMELARLLADRQREEANHLQAAQASERQQTAAVIDGEMRERLEHFDAGQRAQRDRREREYRNERGGISGLLLSIRDILRPEVAAEEERQQDEAAAAFEQQIAAERQAYVRQLEEERQQDLADLDERHAQQQRDQTTQHDGELARYLKEREAAKELAAEIEQQQRLEEKRTRDSPKPTR